MKNIVRDFLTIILYNRTIKNVSIFYENKKNLQNLKFIYKRKKRKK